MGRVALSEAGLLGVAQSRKTAMTMFALRSKVHSLLPSVFAENRCRAQCIPVPASIRPLAGVGPDQIPVHAGASGSVAAPSFPSGAGMPQPAIQYRYWEVPSDLVLISGLPSHVACE